MAATRNLPRLLTISRATAPTSTIAISRRALFTSQPQKYYHSSPPFQQDVSAQQPQKSAGSPIAESMKTSTSPAGNKTTTTAQAGQEDENRNAAFLGEADSDDGFEADVDAHPEAHRHQFSDVSASGMHGQSGEGDVPYDRPRTNHGFLDGTNSAYLGEADSNDAQEADRAAYPEDYEHKIADANNAAFLGEADSDDAYEADRAANPEKHRHKIEDAGASGQHGEAGEGDQNIPRGAKGRRFV